MDEQNVDMAPEVIAAKVLEMIALEENTWLSQPLLEADKSPTACGTALCAAGWAVHVAGYNIRKEDSAVFDSEGVFQGYVDKVGKRLLGLQNAAWMFYTDEDTALAALQALANGEELTESQVHARRLAEEVRVDTPVVFD